MSSYSRIGVLGRRGVLSMPDAAALTGSWSLDELDGGFAADEPMAAGAPRSAEELAAEAKAEAERQTAEAAAERARELDAAHAAGLAAGMAKGVAAERQRLTSTLAALDEAMTQLQAGEARWMGALESNVTAIAMAAARHVIGREVAAEPGLLRDVLARALAEFPADDSLTVRLHPTDLAVVAGEGVLRQIRWTADASIAPGGCLVEGRERIVDGRVDTALERLYRLLTHANA
jgi:flagellar assembly protein FliH